MHSEDVARPFPLGSVLAGVRTAKVWQLVLGVCFILIAPMIPSVAHAVKLNVCLGTPTGPDCAGSTGHMTGSPVITETTRGGKTAVNLAGKTFGPATIPGTSTQFSVTVTTCTSAQNTQCGGSSTLPAAVVVTDGAASDGLLVDSVDLVDAVITVNVTGVAANATIPGGPARFTFQYESDCGEMGALVGGSYPVAADINAKATKNDGVTSLGVTGSTSASTIRLTNRVNIFTAPCTPAPGTLVNVTAPTAAPSVLCEATTTNPYSSPTTGICNKQEIQGQQGTSTLPILCGTTGVPGSCIAAFRQDLTLACKLAGCKFTVPKGTAGTLAPTVTIEKGGIGQLIAATGGQSYNWPTTDQVGTSWLPPTPNRNITAAQDIPLHFNITTRTSSTPSSFLMTSKPSDNTTPVTVPSAANDSSYAGVAILPLGSVEFGQMTEASAVWRYTQGDCAKSLFWAITVLHEGFLREILFDYGQVFDAALTSPSLTSTGGYKDCTTSPTGGGEPGSDGIPTTAVTNIFAVKDKPGEGQWDASQVGGPVRANLQEVLQLVRRDFVTQARVVLLPRGDGEDATVELFKIKVRAGNLFQFETPGLLGFTTASGSEVTDCVGRGQVTVAITKTGPAGDPKVGGSVEFVQGEGKGFIEFEQNQCRYDLAAPSDRVVPLGPGDFEAQVRVSGFPLFPTLPFALQ